MIDTAPYFEDDAEFLGHALATKQQIEAIKADPKQRVRIGDVFLNAADAGVARAIDMVKGDSFPVDDRARLDVIPGWLGRSISDTPAETGDLGTSILKLQHYIIWQHPELRDRFRRVLG